jgi:hypothetical protein
VKVLKHVLRVAVVLGRERGLSLQRIGDAMKGCRYGHIGVTLSALLIRRCERSASRQVTAAQVLTLRWLCPLLICWRGWSKRAQLTGRALMVRVWCRCQHSNALLLSACRVTLLVTGD